MPLARHRTKSASHLLLLFEAIAHIMKYHKIVSNVSFFICLLTCFCLEAIFIHAKYTFLPAVERMQITWFELLFLNWSIGHLLLYLSIFSVYFVIIANRNNPVIKIAWLFFSLIMLYILATTIPEAKEGRWGCSACQNASLFYVFILPVPAIIFIFIGAFWGHADKSKHSDTA